MPDRLPVTALIFAVPFLLAVTAYGADAPCVVTRVGSFAMTDGGLEVVESERAELRTGDRLLQLNGRRLASCEDFTAALQDAQRQGVLAVLALHRDDSVQTVLLTVQQPIEVVAAATPTPPFPQTPTRQALRSNPAALVPMAAALQTFGEEIRLPITDVQGYERRFAELRQTYRELRARDEAIAAADPIMAYYEAVAVFVNHQERTAVDRVARDGASAPNELARARMPANVIEYTTASDVGEWLGRYAFLEPSIVRRPRWMGQAEYAGLWRPDEAIRLLVERARKESRTLATP